MKSKVLFLLLFLAYFQTVAQTEQKLEGYAQVRLEYQKNTNPYFYIRRAKYWYSVKREFADHSSLKFKVKVAYETKKQEFEFLDFKTTYHKKKSEVNLGQFVPDFALQRSQSDQYISVLERALVVNTLIPAAQTSARDIGIQYTYHLDSLKSRFSIGIFNGTGANNLTLSQNSFLITSRLSYFFIKNNDFRMSVGFSGMYRQIENADFNKFYYEDSLFSGIDIRYGAELLMCYKNFHFQTEFIQAKLNNDIAQGFYGLADYRFGKNQFAFSYENMQNIEENLSQRILFEYSYLIDNDDIKLSAGVYYFPNSVQNFLGVIQFQYIFPTFVKK